MPDLCDGMVIQPSMRFRAGFLFTRCFFQFFCRGRWCSWSRSTVQYGNKTNPAVEVGTGRSLKINARPEPNAEPNVLVLLKLSCHQDRPSVDAEKPGGARTLL